MADRIPGPARVAHLRGLLQPHIDDPDVYWATLVDLLTTEVHVLDDVHGNECNRDTCYTCQYLTELLAILDAHDTLQPSGCACADHITYPRRATQDAA